MVTLSSCVRQNNLKDKVDSGSNKGNGGGGGRGHSHAKDKHSKEVQVMKDNVGTEDSRIIYVKNSMHLTYFFLHMLLINMK